MRHDVRVPWMMDPTPHYAAEYSASLLSQSGSQQSMRTEWLMMMMMRCSQVVPILKLHSELHAGAPVSLPFLKDNQSVCVYYVSLLVCLCVCTSVCLEACLLARHVRLPGTQSRPLDAALCQPRDFAFFGIGCPSHMLLARNSFGLVWGVRAPLPLLRI